MKYWIIWDRGCCNEGDHASGVELCDTLESAAARAAMLLGWDHETSITIIRGEEVSLPEPQTPA